MQKAKARKKHPPAMDGTRVCKSCGEEQHVTMFYANCYRSLGRGWKCRTCMSQYFRLRYPTIKARAKEAPLKRKYGVTLQQVDAMSASQDHRCAICGKIPEDSLCIDHDHDTGAVRGLLCRQCNAGLGLFRDDPQLLMSAVKYLDYHLQMEVCHDTDEG